MHPRIFCAGNARADRRGAAPRPATTDGRKQIRDVDSSPSGIAWELDLGTLTPDPSSPPPDALMF